MIKYLQKQEYSSRTKVFVKEKVEHVTFNFTLENQVHRQGEYFNDKWVTFTYLFASRTRSVHSILFYSKFRCLKNYIFFLEKLKRAGRFAASQDMPLCEHLRFSPAAV